MDQRTKMDTELTGIYDRQNEERSKEAQDDAATFEAQRIQEEFNQ